MATAPTRTRTRANRLADHQRRPDPSEGGVHTVTGAQVLERIRQNQRNPLDAVIDRSVATGQPAQPTPEDLDMVEEGIGQHLTGLSEDPAFQREYRLRLLHRMLMRQLPMTLIARSLNCSVRNVYVMREKLYAQLREEASNKDLPSYVGMTDGFYNDVIGMCMRMASSAKTTDIRKLGALQVALQAQRDRTHFYEIVGFHDVLKITPVTGMFDRATDQASKLGKMAENILAAFNDGLDDMPEDGSDDVFARAAETEENTIRTRVL